VASIERSSRSPNSVVCTIVTNALLHDQMPASRYWRRTGFNSPSVNPPIDGTMFASM
jgi:hypothetical protein